MVGAVIREPDGRFAGSISPSVETPRVGCGLQRAAPHKLHELVVTFKHFQKISVETARASAVSAASSLKRVVGPGFYSSTFSASARTVALAKLAVLVAIRLRGANGGPWEPLKTQRNILQPDATFALRFRAANFLFSLLFSMWWGR
jgi:hypothetical protein